MSRRPSSGRRRDPRARLREARRRPRSPAGPRSGLRVLEVPLDDVGALAAERGVERIRFLVVGFGEDESVRRPGLARERAHQLLPDPAAAVSLVHFDLVDEQDRRRTMAAPEDIAEGEADRLAVLEGREEDRALVLEQLEVRRARGELADDVPVLGPEPADLHSANRGRPAAAAVATAPAAAEPARARACACR